MTTESKTLLVTGLSGFVGQHLLRLLPDTWRLLDIPDFDLLSPESLDRCLSAGSPDAVIHLAGQTFVPESFRNPHQTFETNLLGTLNLLQSLKRASFCGSFLYVSSGDVYGRVEFASLPVNERHPVRPLSPYAISKVSAELLCLQWSYTERWRVMVARPFNHIGSGQRLDFVIPAVAQQLARIQRGLQEPQVAVGDIDVSRDFLDVRDVVTAYFCLLEHGRSGEVYNVCSGEERIVRDLLAQLAELAGVAVDWVQDTARLRPSEQRRMAGCAQKIQEHTGWKPGISMTETLQNVLSDWVARERQE